MAKFSETITGLINKDVIITTILNDQLHGGLIVIDEEAIVLKMVDQDKFINLSHVVSVTPKRPH